jgi:predicted porin
MTKRAILIAGLQFVLAASVQAQSQQRLSIQGSGALVFPTAKETAFNNTTRLGWEGQLRYTFSRFSLGAGYQRSTVYKVEGSDFLGAVSSIFVEPRYRVGMSQLVCSPEEDCAEQSWEAAYGGGAGLLYLLGSRVSLDLGSQYFATRYSTATGGTINTGYVLARLGLSVGL